MRSLNSFLAIFFVAIAWQESKAMPQVSSSCQVTCKLTIDNRIDSVFYNGASLTVTGVLNEWEEENSFTFSSCDYGNPGELVIQGHDYNDLNNCDWGGLILHCTAEDTWSPWHNFVSDTIHWKVSDGSTPCTNSAGMIAAGKNIDFVADLWVNGANKIWSNKKTVKLIGKPEPVCDSQVTCKLTIDNRIDSVFYNGASLNVTGVLNDWEKENSFTFSSCNDCNPGELVIQGHDYNDLNNCDWGGLILHCTADVPWSPWHNFVSDTIHWKVSDGSTPCTNSAGMIAAGKNIDFVADLLVNGAQKIWSDKKTVKLIGKPEQPSCDLLRNLG